jgi:sigma-70-like protein
MPPKKITLEALQDFAEAGRSIKDTAAELGVSYSTVFARAKRAGIAFKRPPSPCIRVSDPSGEEMVKLYAEGQTLHQIGVRYGVTRERVRQILAKHHGINGKKGGAYVVSRRRAISRAARRDAKYLAKHGCSFAQYKELLEIGRSLIRLGVPRSRTPVGAYFQQRNNANNCGYEWQLTLWEWWTIWKKSGHWNERGRGNGYWLRRRDKSGAFTVENVFIASGAECLKASKARSGPTASYMREH